MRVIAKELGISHQRVSQLFQEVCDEIPAARLADMRNEEGELADAAIRDLLSMATNKNVSPRTRAELWGQIRGWSESKRKLFGVDAPTRRELTVVSEDTVNNAIAELNLEIARMDAQAATHGVDTSSLVDA